MNNTPNLRVTKGSIMENLFSVIVPIAIVAGWIILQVWVLPRFGVRT